MAHRAITPAYKRLSHRLNRYPQGAPASKLLFKILRILFTEKEAELVSKLPIKPFSAGKAARIWHLSPGKTERVLNSLCNKALLLDIVLNGKTLYILPPPMAGFFEFSLMRLRNDIDQNLLSRLFYQYLNQQDDFILKLFTEGETQLGRVFVCEEVLSHENSLRVLDYERAGEVIHTATAIGISICYCRHKMYHLSKDCNAPKHICMSFNTAGASLVRHGFARKVEAVEALDLLHKAYDHNLVQFGENVQKGVNFICNCCGCCCEAMGAAKRFGMLQPVHTTNFIPNLDLKCCSGCGRCGDVCPVSAIELVKALNPKHPKKKIARLDKHICLGCGICAKECSSGAIKLASRPERVITPIDSIQRVTIMAIERGKLQHLIVDNHVLTSHRAVAALLGVILRLPPLKQTLANRQLQSRYLDTLITRQ
jgi:ferredoxin